MHEARGDFTDHPQTRTAAYIFRCEAVVWVSNTNKGSRKKYLRAGKVMHLVQLLQLNSKTDLKFFSFSSRSHLKHSLSELRLLQLDSLCYAHELEVPRWQCVVWATKDKECAAECRSIVRLSFSADDPNQSFNVFSQVRFSFFFFHGDIQSRKHLQLSFPVKLIRHFVIR